MLLGSFNRARSLSKKDFSIYASQDKHLIDGSKLKNANSASLVNKLKKESLTDILVQFTSEDAFEPHINYHKMRLSSDKSTDFTYINLKNLTGEEKEWLINRFNLTEESLASLSYIYCDKDGFQFPAMRGEEFLSELEAQQQGITPVLGDDLFAAANKKDRLCLVIDSSSSKKVRETFRKLNFKLGSNFPNTLFLAEYSKETSNFTLEKDILHVFSGEDNLIVSNKVGETVKTGENTVYSTKIELKEEETAINQILRLLKGEEGELTVLENLDLAGFRKSVDFGRKQQSVIVFNSADTLQECRSLVPQIREIGNGLAPNYYYTCDRDIASLFNVYLAQNEQMTVRFIDYSKIFDSYKGKIVLEVGSQEELVSKLSTVKDTNTLFTAKYKYNLPSFNRKGLETFLNKVKNREESQYFEDFTVPISENSVLKPTSSSKLPLLLQEKGVKLVFAVDDKSVGGSSVLSFLENQADLLKDANLFVYDKGNESALIPRRDSNTCLYVFTDRLESKFDIEALMKEQDWKTKLKSILVKYV